MKHLKKIILAVVMVSVLMTLLIMPSIAAPKRIETFSVNYATGGKIKILNPVLDQSVEEVNKTINSETEDFVIGDVFWVKNYPLPTVVSKDKVVGRLHMGKNGLEDDKGEPVETMENTDKFEWDTKYLLVLSITSTKAPMDEASEIKLNGKTMVYEGFADAEKTGEYLLFAEQLMASAKECPNAIFEATGSNSGVLTNVDTSMEYSKDGGTSWAKCESDKEVLYGVTEGFIYVRYTQDTQNVQKIYVLREKTPEAVGTVPCTNAENNDGKIIGVDSSMEFRDGSETEYTKIVGTTIAGLKAGTYYVRREANGNHLASGDVTVKVPEYKDVPVIETQPKSVTVDTGKDAKLTIKAKGKDLKYEWHYIDVKNGQDVTINMKEESKYFDGQGTDTLTIKSVNKLNNKEFDCEYNGDKYFCVVSNDSGKVVSTIVNYSVNHVPKTNKWLNDSTNHWQVCVCGKIINKAEHVDKNKDGKCDVCKYDMSHFKKIPILFGEIGIWEPGTAEPYRIICDVDYKEFKELLVDSKKVDSKYYTVSKGSTIIDIKPEFMDKLSNNSHTITIRFADGTVSAEVTILSNDHKNIQPIESQKLIYLLIGLGGVVLAVIIMLIVLLAKKNKK